MAKVTIRYWAAAKEAAGVAEESVDAVTLRDALNAAVGQPGAGHPAGGRHREVVVPGERRSGGPGGQGVDRARRKVP